MSIYLQGNTIGRYGNPYHAHTLAGAKLIFYRYEGSVDDVPAKPLWGFSPADPGDISAPILGQAIVADDGTFKTQLEGYKKGPLLVALQVEKFSYAPATGKQVFGLLGVGVPQWNQREELVLDIDLAKKSYCRILAALDLWLVAGRVSDCAQVPTPLIGGLVKAFDRDVTQDDFLGSDTTDATGSFSIFFGSSTFRQIPSLPPPFDIIPPHELFGGPDVFFQVFQGTTPLLEESPSQGRASGRENVSHCSYHELCVEAPGFTVDTLTLWSSIGNYDVPDGGGLKDFDADGFVNSGKLAFTGNIDFNGQLSQLFMGEAVSFRFVYAEWSDMSTAPAYPADYAPLLDSNINLNAKYGSNYHFIGPDPWDYSLTDVLPIPDSDGWIAVDQSPSFVRDTGRMIQVRTSTLVPSLGSLSTMEGTADAGAPVPAGPLRDRPRKFSFVLEIKTASLSAHQAVPVPIHINNSYVYLRYNLSELVSNSCNPITISAGSVTVHPMYTVAHPYLQYYTINVQRQGGSNMVVKSEQYTDTGNGVLWTDSMGESGTETAVYTDVGPCSYRSSIVVDRRLTNGYSGVTHQDFLRTFCVD